MRRRAGIAVGAACVFVAGLLLAGCGSSGTRTNALSTALTGGGIDAPTVTRQPVTLTETLPVTITETSPTETVTRTATVVQTTEIEITTPAPVTTEAATTTSSISPGAAAAAGAAAATQNSESDQTDWGWVAFGILAALVLIGLAVWWWRSRHARPAST
jgi:cobalamin biosynthesis Mg chelatase CobN